MLVMTPDIQHDRPRGGPRDRGPGGGGRRTGQALRRHPRRGRRELRRPHSSVLGLLGPNGAGKTTLVRMLTTLSVPTRGTGRVAGFDIITQPNEVRRSMGLTGQAATVDEILTGRENLKLIGALYIAQEVRRRGQSGSSRASISPTPPTGRPRPTRRHAPPAGPGGEPAGDATDPVPRRADHRARPAQPIRAVGGAARAGPGGHHAGAPRSTWRSRPPGRRDRRQGRSSPPARPPSSRTVRARRASWC